MQTVTTFFDYFIDLIYKLDNLRNDHTMLLLEQETLDKGIL